MFQLKNDIFLYSASKQIILSHVPYKKEQELYNKKKSAQGSQKSSKGRPVSVAADPGQLISEDEPVTVVTVEEKASTPQQVDTHLHYSMALLLKI